MRAQLDGAMRSRRGFALIAALWLLVAFAAVGTAISVHARARRLGAANTLDEDRGRAAAVAGLEHARGRLAQLAGGNTPTGAQMIASIADPWREAVLLLADTNELGDQRYHISMRDAGAALNINRASEEQLRRFFIALRIDAGRATEIAQSIMDWRDSDNLHRLHGGETGQYLRMGSAVLPANGVFSRIEELQYVKGMTPAIFARAQPYLTVMGTGMINLNTAPRPVLLSLPGMTEEAAAVLERTRESAEPIQSLEELSLQLSSGAREQLARAISQLMPFERIPGIGFQTFELHVRSEGWTDGSPVHRQIDALVVRAGGLGVVVFRQES